MQLITRAEWGAQYSNGEPDVTLPLRWQDNWLHHSVTAWLPSDATLAQEIAAIREIEDIGQREFSQGISYTRIIPASGRVFEGHSLDRRGAHTYRRNDSSRAICLIGNYEHDQPTPAQLRSAAAVVREWHAAGYCPRPALSGGHRDVYATACPGEHAYAAIPEINRLAGSGEPLDLEDTLSWDDPLTTPDGKNTWPARTFETYTNLYASEVHALLTQKHTAPNGQKYTLPEYIIWGNHYAAQADAKVAALTAAFTAFAAAQGSDITEDKLREIVERAVEQHIQITGSVEITARPAPMQEVPNS